MEARVQGVLGEMEPFPVLSAFENFQKKNIIVDMQVRTKKIHPNNTVVTRDFETQMLFLRFKSLPKFEGGGYGSN